MENLKLNGYIAIYERKQIEIYAVSLYAAKVEACKRLNVRKSKEHMVSVMLCELPDGSEVTHTADF